MTTLARRTDPLSSHLAAARHAPAAQSNKALLYEWVCRYPGYSSNQIADAIGMERHEVARRLPDLRHDGLLESRVPVGGGELTWWPAEGSGQQELGM